MTQRIRPQSTRRVPSKLEQGYIIHDRRSSVFERATTTLLVTVRDRHGKVVGVRKVIGDLYTIQWAAMMWTTLVLALQKTVAEAAINPTTYSNMPQGIANTSLGTISGNILHSTDGTAIYFGSPASQSAMCGALEQMAAGVNVLKFAIGKGAGVAAATDSALANATGDTGAPSIPSVALSTNQNQISLAVTISPASTPVTITEAGLQALLYVLTAITTNGTYAQKTILLTHDFFTGVSVPGGGTVSLALTLNFN